MLEHRCRRSRHHHRDEHQCGLRTRRVRRVRARGRSFLAASGRASRLLSGLPFGRSAGGPKEPDPVFHPCSVKRARGRTDGHAGVERSAHPASRQSPKGSPGAGCGRRPLHRRAGRLRVPPRLIRSHASSGGLRSGLCWSRRSRGGSRSRRPRAPRWWWPGSRWAGPRPRRWRRLRSARRKREWRRSATGSRAVRGGEGGNLAQAEATVTRVRLGLEGTWRGIGSGDGASLTPTMEMGLRHDGGDAETGFGVDVGAGLSWSDPRRGLSLGVQHSVGAQASGGMDTLLGRPTLGGRAGARRERRRRRGGAALRGDARLRVRAVRRALHGDARGGAMAFT